MWVAWWFGSVLFNAFLSVSEIFDQPTNPKSLFGYILSPFLLLVVATRSVDRVPEPKFSGVASSELMWHCCVI